MNTLATLKQNSVEQQDRIPMERRRMLDSPFNTPSPYSMKYKRNIQKPKLDLEQTQETKLERVSDPTIDPKLEQLLKRFPKPEPEPESKPEPEPELNETLILLEGTDGKPVGLQTDPSTGDFYTCKKSGHLSCVETKYSVLSVFCMTLANPDSTIFTENPQMEPNCTICGQPLIRPKPERYRRFT